MKTFLITIGLIGLTFNSFSQTLQSPAEFLGYELGDKFTRHHRIVEYFQHVAATSNNVILEEYGQSYEGRTLLTVTLSSAENMAGLDQIKENNLRRAGLASGAATIDPTAIVWLSYNIHGNEASSSEATMRTVYELVNPNNKQAQEWLKNTVVIIDPCVNPDGRDRYANFYNQYGALPSYNPSIDASEHREPWPGGRPNHYLFDLNRDWAWQSQVESATRMQAYKKWMPHIHVDFHEQGYNSPYYFAPAAEPFHEVITDWQREFQTSIGKNHAKYFDAENWTYFTRESFDLFYPSYGDTYPTYNGAIGMTYEQAGHSLAGLGIITEYGDTLTLKDRLTHHHVTGISTVEIASQNAQKLADEFKKFFDNSKNNPKIFYKSYVIKGSNNPDKLARFMTFLDNHQIEYGHTSSRKIVRGFAYHEGKDGVNTTLAANDIVIKTAQARAALLTALMEPHADYSDSLTYDITAWAIPFAFGLEAYALEAAVNDIKPISPVQKEKISLDASAYAYVSDYKDFEDARFLSALHQAGIQVRMAPNKFAVAGKPFNEGALIVTQRNNEHIKNLAQKVESLANEFGRNVSAVKSGFVDFGNDFGSNDVFRLKRPEVAVLSGAGSSSLAYGEVWHFFEQQLGYPVTSIRTDYFSGVDLSKYNVLIIPSGYYGSYLNEKAIEKIADWVDAGGKLILMQGAISTFADKNGFTIKHMNDEEKKKWEEKDKDPLKVYGDSERKSLSDMIIGAVYKLNMDQTHPLAYGYDNSYMTLKTTATRYAFLENGWNIGYIKGAAKPVSGFAGHKANSKQENSLVFGVQDKGRGTVVYMVDDPLFRAFWHNGRLLFSNAVFLVGND